MRLCSYLLMRLCRHGITSAINCKQEFCNRTSHCVCASKEPLPIGVLPHTSIFAINCTHSLGLPPATLRPCHQHLAAILLLPIPATSCPLHWLAVLLPSRMAALVQCWCGCHSRPVSCTPIYETKPFCYPYPLHKYAIVYVHKCMILQCFI